MLYMILIVDDEALTRQLLRLLLHRAGYEVAEAVDGQDALEQLRATRPRLIILDLLMPRLDGCATLRQIRANPQTRHIPTLMLSSRADCAAEAVGIATGAQAYIKKPFNCAALLAQIKAVLGATAVARPFT